MSSSNEKPSLPPCPRCNSNNVIKNGCIVNKYGEENQRYRCKNCKKKFVLVDRRVLPNKEIRKAILFRELTDGKTIRGASRSAEISPATAINWMRIFDKELPNITEVYEDSISEDPDINKDFQIDEMWHFLDHKDNKLWLIKIYDSSKNLTVGYELGNRDEITVINAYEKIRHFTNVTFYVDDWISFRKVLNYNGATYRVGKEYTYPIEQNNSNTRHYISRFHRRTKVVSRSQEMVSISLKLQILRYDYPHTVAHYLRPCFPPRGWTMAGGRGEGVPRPIN